MNDSLNQQMNSYNASIAPAQSSGSGFDLGSLLPTVGSIGGGILGEMVDPFGGGIIGASLGGGLGKGLENFTQGQNPIQGNDITAAIEGGLGQGAGEIGADLLGGIGGKLADMGGNALAKQAEAKATADTAQTLADNWARLPATEKEALNFGNSMDLAGQAGIDQTPEGFMTARTIGTGVDPVTGRKGFLNDTLDNIVHNAYAGSNQGVDLSGYRSAIEQAIKDKGGLGDLSPTTGGKGGFPTTAGTPADSLVSDLEQRLQQQAFHGEGNLNGDIATVDDALNLQRNLEQLNRVQTGTSDAALTRQHAIKTALDYVKQQVGANPAVDEAVAKYTVPDAEANMLRGLSKTTTGSEDYGNFLINKVNRAKSYRDISDLERQLVDMGKAGERANSINTNVIGTSAEAKAAQAASEEANQPHPLVDAAGNVISGGKGNLISTVYRGAAKMSPSIAKKAGGLLQRMSPFTGNGNQILDKILPAIGATVGTSPNVAQAAATQGGSMLPSSQPSIGLPGTQGLPQPSIMDTYRQALTLSADPFLASAMGPIVSQLAPVVQKLQGAQAAIPATEAAYKAAGGGMGLAPGLLVKLGGFLTGGPASTYEQQRQQLIQQLNALGIPASYVPDITQTATPGALGFGSLQNVLGAMSGTQPILPSVPQQ